MSKLITKPVVLLIGWFVATAAGSSAVAQEPTPKPSPEIIRKDVLTALIGDRSVGKVEIKRIDFVPDQKTGLHRHPCPVVGYVAHGKILFQAEGEPPRSLSEGDAWFEPAGSRIVHFDNGSSQDPATFIAFYLLGKDDEKLIEMLE
jgi:quercetin dioxygenase-like cupin family protein